MPQESLHRIIPTWKFEGDPEPTGTPKIDPAIQAQLDELQEYKKTGMPVKDIVAMRDDYVSLVQEAEELKKRGGSSAKSATEEDDDDDDVDEQPVQKKKGKEKVATDPKRAHVLGKIRTEVLAAIPELENLGDLTQVHDAIKSLATQQQQRAISSVNDSLFDATRALVNSLQIDTSTQEGKDLALSIGDLVETTVMGNQTFLTRYLAGDRTVVRDAIKQVQESAMLKHLNVPKKPFAQRRGGALSFEDAEDAQGVTGRTALDNIKKSLEPVKDRRARLREIASRSFDIIFRQP